MKGLLERVNDWAEWLDADDPDEPAYDPVHLGEMLILCLVVIGALYWILWTLLVFEGGLQAKVAALAHLIGGKPYNPDDFEGWIGNVGALVFAGLALAGLRSLYRQAQSKAAK